LDTIYSFRDQFILAYYRKTTTTISSVNKITKRKKYGKKSSLKIKELCIYTVVGG
jgi:hypothetical protein